MRLPPSPLGKKKQEKGVGDSRQRNIVGEDQVKIEAEAGVTWTSANKGWHHQELGKVGRRSLEGAEPCPEVDLKLLAPWTVKEQTSVILSHKLCADMLG